MPRRRRIIFLFVPVPVILLASLLETLGLIRPLGDRLYDLFMRLEPSAPVARELLLVDIDDRATAVLGAWPWGRDVLADGLLVAKEFDARYAVLDTPFAGQAPLGVDRHVLREELPDQLTLEFARIEENVRSLFDAIRRGSVRPADSPRYVAELLGLIGTGQARLEDTVARVERDNDVYLGQALRLFERAFVSAELDFSRGAAPPSPAELLPVAHFALQGVSASGLAPLGARAAFLPVPAVAHGARGGGFRELTPDSDGVVRRARLLATFRGWPVAQAAFAALLDRLGNPDLTVSPDALTLALSPHALSIPLTPEGDVLIEWAHARPASPIRRLSWYELARHVQLEADLLACLREMDRSGLLDYYRADPSLLELYAASASIREGVLSGGETGRLVDWRDTRSRFFALSDAFLNGDTEQRALANAARILASEGPSEEEKAAIERMRDRIPALFREGRILVAHLQTLRASLQETLAGSFCVVAVTGPAATVIGSTPFGRPATPGESSAALVNTILTRAFLRDLQRWYGVAAAALASLLLALVLLRARPRASILTGIISAAAACLASALVMILARIFVDPTPSAGCLVVVGFVISLVKVRQQRADREQW